MNTGVSTMLGFAAVAVVQLAGVMLWAAEPAAEAADLTTVDAVPELLQPKLP